MKTQRGITLIALIITITVLLILAVAAIGAVQESDIIGQAEYTVERYQIEKIEEKIKLEKNAMKLAEYGKEITVVDIVQKCEGEVKEPVNIVANAKSIPENMPEGEYYILTPEKYASNNENVRRYAKLTSRGEEREENIIRDVYVINEHLDVYYVIEGVLSEIDSEEENQSSEPVDTTLSIGRTIYYDSNNDNKKEEWIVYSLNEENNFEIISANSMGNLKLGYEDPYLPATVGDLDGNGTAEENVDKAIYSYNHAIETINNYCEALVTATDHSGVRSIGATTAQDTVGMEHWNVLKGGDNYGQEAITYLSSLGGNNYLTSKNFNNYWMASRIKKVNGGHSLCIYQVGISNDLNGYPEEHPNLAEIIYIGLMGIPMDSSRSGATKSAGVRPIISNPVNYSFTNE